MARVYANASHTYTHFTDRGGIEYRWPVNGWRDVPDDVADVVCTAHPQKLVRLKPGENEPGEIKPPEPVVETVAEPVAEAAVEPVAEAVAVAEGAESKPRIVLFRSVLKKKEQNK